MGGPSAFSERSLQDLLDAVAARTPAPGGGTVAATAAALAAALVQMAAAFTASTGAEDSARRAGELRERALELAEIELHAYEPVIEALRLPREDPERAARVQDAQAAASRSPFEIARIGAELAEQAAELARTGNPNLSGDAIAGALLAAAAAQAAARLVATNLTAGAAVDDANELARRAQVARDRALG